MKTLDCIRKNEVSLHCSTGSECLFVFDDSSILPIREQYDSTKGRGLISRYALSDSTIVTAIELRVYCVVGRKSSYVCNHCGVVSSKVTVFEDSPEFSFCKRVPCVQYGQKFIEVCGKVLRQILQSTEMDNAIKDIALLATRLLFQSWQTDEHSKWNSSSVYSFLQLEAQKSLPLTESVSSTSKFIDNIQSNCPEMLKYVSKVSAEINTSTEDLIDTILRVVRFNSHSVPIPGLSDTSIFCIVPFLSSLNHSCSPNCILQIQTGNALAQGGPVLYLRAMQGIDAESELTVSYLSNLCISRESRRTLLQESFNFLCQCARCELELLSHSQHTVHPPNQSSSDREIVKIASSMIQDHMGSQLQASSHQQLPLSLSNRLDVALLAAQRLISSMLAGTDGNSLLWDTLYGCHDVAMVMLGTQQHHGETPTTLILTTTVVDQLCHNITAHWIVASGWHLIGCTNSPRRLDYLAAGSQAGIKLLSLLQDEVTSSKRIDGAVGRGGLLDQNLTQRGEPDRAVAARLAAISSSHCLTALALATELANQALAVIQVIGGDKPAGLRDRLRSVASMRSFCMSDQSDRRCVRMDTTGERGKVGDDSSVGGDKAVQPRRGVTKPTSNCVEQFDPYYSTMVSKIAQILEILMKQ